jgi:hypothetical protein
MRTWILPSEPRPGYRGFAIETACAERSHKEAITMAKKAKSKKRGKAKDLSVRKGGGVKGGKMRA